MVDKANDSQLLTQMKKYADDLARVYKSEKSKSRELEAANQQLRAFADDLKESIRELSKTQLELQEAYLDTIHRLVMAAEYKDEDTGNHIDRISRYSAFLAEKVQLPSREVKSILFASPMHDIGKIGIPDQILLKPGKLTADEFEFMKTHTTIGAKILSNSRAEILDVAQRIALTHHEKWNGKGYPQHIAGKEIPIEGRIVGLVDTFDALTSKRPYKDPYPFDVAVKIIESERGVSFDPEVVDIFISCLDDIKRIKFELSDIPIEPLEFRFSERDSELKLS